MWLKLWLKNVNVLCMHLVIHMDYLIDMIKRKKCIILDMEESEIIIIMKIMYLKKVIILLCGIVLGYLTSRRTDMSISLECILGDGVFIVLVITIIMVITKEKIKLGINCAIFGLSFVIGSTWIKNIELFF